MHVFPVESKLKDGTPVFIRLIRPEDKDEFIVQYIKEY